MTEAAIHTADTLGATAQEQVRRYVERIERVTGEIDALAEDRKSIFAEAKAFGFDTKALRKVVALRKIDRQEREEMEAIVDLYLHAIGEI